MPRGNRKPAEKADRSIATVSTLVGISALFSAASCCILPLGLAAIGVGSAGLSAFVPFHWPLTFAALVAVAAGWFFYLRNRRGYIPSRTCISSPRAKSTLTVLCLATVVVAISACWSLIEAPLMVALGGA